MQAASTAAKVKDRVTKTGLRTAARVVISFFLRFTAGADQVGSRQVAEPLMTQNARSCTSNLGTWTAPRRSHTISPIVSRSHPGDVGLLIGERNRNSGPVVGVVTRS